MQQLLPSRRPHHGSNCGSASGARVANVRRGLVCCCSVPRVAFSLGFVLIVLASFADALSPFGRCGSVSLFCGIPVLPLGVLTGLSV